MGKEKELTRYKADLLEDLKDPEYAAFYLQSANDGGSIEDLLLALRDVAEAHKMSVVAEASNLNRENLYKMLSEAGNPRLNSFKAVLNSVGIGFEFVPLEGHPKTGSHSESSPSASRSVSRSQNEITPGAIDSTWKLGVVSPNSEAAGEPFSTGLRTHNPLPNPPGLGANYYAGIWIESNTMQLRP